MARFKFCSLRIRSARKFLNLFLSEERRSLFYNVFFHNECFLIRVAPIIEAFYETKKQKMMRKQDILVNARKMLNSRRNIWQQRFFGFLVDFKCQRISRIVIAGFFKVNNLGRQINRASRRTRYG